MNTEMSVSQKVVALFIVMAVLCVGLGIVARVVGSHYASNQKNCTVSTSQTAEMKEAGVATVDGIVCGTPEK
ncbi:MAG TPA: hypothetical protein VFL85_00095 [Candidatus Saccharimonadales bacterium]|nr:hypothetical protein [Candidatus Saccharimonadales bacterium]